MIHPCSLEHRHGTPFWPSFAILNFVDLLQATCAHTPSLTTVFAGCAFGLACRGLVVRPDHDETVYAPSRKRCSFLGRHSHSQLHSDSAFCSQHIFMHARQLCPAASPCERSQLLRLHFLWFSLVLYEMSPFALFFWCAFSQHRLALFPRCSKAEVIAIRRNPYSRVSPYERQTDSIIR
ncbi:hypothetical protein BKA63DRAFT_271713 [Paraphoma chrysanthemicola]|nr:hypothetical protein BKA63DRAFT_271713 [Paraphoma chrysanthemicola]